MMKLYYLPGACSLADHIVLRWSGLPFELQAMSHDQLHAPDFLKINPMGAVPALTDGDWVLTQNVAILEYIAEQAPQAELLGGDQPRARAEVRRWLAFINADVHKTFGPLFGAARYVKDEAAQAELRASAAATLRKQFGILDAQLAGREWIAGSRSVADAYLYVVLRWAQATKIDLSGYDSLAAFAARMQADPAVAKALENEGLT